MAKKKTTKSVESKITMTNAQLITGFHPAITSLGSLNLRELSVLIAVTNAKKEADSKVEDFYGLRKTIAEQDCVKDENGKPKVVSGNSYDYPSEEVKEATFSRIRELEETEVTLTVTPIDVNKLENVDGITPNTVVALKDFIKL